MAATPKYVLRIARLPRVLERLAAEPAGLPLATLAAEVGVPVEELREDLLAFYTADVGSDWLLGLTRPSVLDFLGPDGEDDPDPAAAEVVRILVADPAEELGVEYVDAAELALVFTAASALLDIEPDNTDLADAVDVLTETMLGTAEEVAALPRDGWSRSLPVLQEAARTGRVARIEYSRAWDPGVGSRTIHPYQLVQTRRGWEIDAGPIGDHGGIWTYLLSNVRSVELLGERFTPPTDLADRLAAQRATTTVRVCLPQAARWAADMYAESVTVVEDDEESVVLDVGLLPPLERRVGMLLLASGPEAFVVSPRELEDAGAVLAEELLVHHSVVSAEE